MPRKNAGIFTLAINNEVLPSKIMIVFFIKQTQTYPEEFFEDDDGVNIELEITISNK